MQVLAQRVCSHATLHAPVMVSDPEQFGSGGNAHRRLSLSVTATAFGTYG